MFDIVRVPCPKCGALNESQSKGGDCTLTIYDLDNAPPEILADLSRYGTQTCDECGASFRIMVRCMAVPVLVKPQTD